MRRTWEGVVKKQVRSSTLNATLPMFF